MKRRNAWSRALICVLLNALISATALAHENEPPEPHDLWTAWSWEPGVIVGLALSAWLYFRGSYLMRRRIDSPDGRHKWETASFVVGWVALFIALISPVHALGSALFSAHMLQHEILMVIAAPLLVLSRPLMPFLWALPLGWRRRLGTIGKKSWLYSSWHWLVSPLAAWLLHAAVLWLWHAPPLFQATLKNDLIHTAQHLSFFISALVFYEALGFGQTGRERRMGYGAAVIYVFATAVHTSVLGALLTFSNMVWYPAYRETTAAWGVTPLEDQQLGGLIMWVPAGVIYIIAGLALLAAWLREAEHSMRRREGRAG